MQRTPFCAMGPPPTAGQAIGRRPEVSTSVTKAKPRTRSRGDGFRIRAASRARCLLGEPCRHVERVQPAVTPMDNPVVQRRLNQQADRQKHQQKTHALHAFRGRAPAAEAFFEHALELKPEKHLGAQNQQARFVQRGRQFSFQLHACPHGAGATSRQTSAAPVTRSAFRR